MEIDNDPHCSKNDQRIERMHQTDDISSSSTLGTAISPSTSSSSSYSHSTCGPPGLQLFYNILSPTECETLVQTILGLRDKEKSRKERNQQSSIDDSQKRHESTMKDDHHNNKKVDDELASHRNGKKRTRQNKNNQDDRTAIEDGVYMGIPAKYRYRNQSRELLQYGIFTHSNRVKLDVSLPPLPSFLEDVIDKILERLSAAPSNKRMSKTVNTFSTKKSPLSESKAVDDKNIFINFLRTKRPNACTINIYPKGAWLPPHIDNVLFSRPFFSISLQSEQEVWFVRRKKEEASVANHSKRIKCEVMNGNMTFFSTSTRPSKRVNEHVSEPGNDGSNEHANKRGNIRGNEHAHVNDTNPSSSITQSDCNAASTNLLIHKVKMPIGSCIVLNGESADEYQHALPPMSEPRISLTFRHLNGDREELLQAENDRKTKKKLLQEKRREDKREAKRKWLEEVKQRDKEKGMDNKGEQSGNTSGGTTTNASGASTNPKKEIYTYKAPYNLYGLAWSNRVGKPFRLALGSFIEEYTNKVDIIQLNPETNALEKVAQFDHPYPTTKIMWYPSSSSSSSTSTTTSSAAATAAKRTTESSQGQNETPSTNETKTSNKGTTDNMGGASTGTTGTSTSSLGDEDLLATTGDYLRIWRVEEDENGFTKVRKRALFNNNNANNEYCAPLTSFDWNETDPSMICTSSIDTTCTIWNAETEQAKCQLIAHDKEVYDVAFAPPPAKDVFVSVGNDGSVRMFDLRSMEHSTIIYESSMLEAILRIAWNKQDPNYLAAIMMDATKTIILDIRVPTINVADLDGHSACVNTIAWAPHSSCHICSAGDDSQALIWDLNAIPDPIEDPILAYNAGQEINNMGWSNLQPDWVSIAYGNEMQMLRV
eukprot:g2372.t1